MNNPNPLLLYRDRFGMAMSEGSQTEQVDFVLSDMLCQTLEVHSKIRQPETKYLPDLLKAVGSEGSINC